MRDRLLLLLFLGLGVALGLGAVAAGDVPQPDAEAERLFQEGFDLQAAGRTEEALARYQAVLARAPDHVPALYEIGWSWWKLERWEECVATWERVLALDPGHADAGTWLPQARANLRLTKADPGDLGQVGPDAVPRKEGPALRFALGGDTMLGSPTTKSGLPPDGGAHLLDPFRDLMVSADVAFVNLEGVLLDGAGKPKCEPDGESCHVFRSPTSYAGLLVAAGVDVVSVANNHAGDFGQAGRQSTWSALERAGIAFSGPLGIETVMERGGARIGVLAFSTSAGHNDIRKLDAAKVLVAELAGRVDLVVVSFHGGAEGASAQHVRGAKETFLGEDRGDVRAFAHAVIDAGADLVVGHGPHVLRGIELYRERLVLYSLGNFCTYGGFSLVRPNSVTALAVVDLHPDGRFASGRLVPAMQVWPGGPKPDAEGEAIGLVRTLSQEDFGAGAAPIAGDGSIGAPGAAAAPTAVGEPGGQR